MISPKMMTTPVLQTVSQAIREDGSRVRQASTIASEMVSHNLSGWDSVTDSEANRNESAGVLSSMEAAAAVPVGVLGWWLVAD